VNCPHCHETNLQPGNFCQFCGGALTSPGAGGTTVAMPSSAVIRAISPDDMQTITRQAEKLGTAASLETYTLHNATRATQREHCFCVVDCSSSMGTMYDADTIKLLAAIRANATMVIEKAQIDPQDEIGIVVFRSTARKLLDLCPLHSHKPQILRALQSLRPDNGTDINEGLKVARDLFDWRRRDVVRRILLLTDGHGGKPLGTARELRSKGVVIDVIGIGPNPSAVDETLLRQVASVIEGESRYTFIRDLPTLLTHFTNLAGKTATR